MFSKKEYYNNEPVFYCKDCMSLAILNVDNYNYCRDCGSTDVDVCMIDDWEQMYELKHGVKFLKESKKK